MNEEQHLALKTELAKPAYSAMTDPQEKADALNAKTVANYKKVPYDHVIAYLTAALKIDGILLAKSTKASAREVLFLATESGLTGFDLSDSNTLTSVTRLLDALVADALIDAANKDFILAMANDPVSTAQSLGLGVVYDFNVINAEVM